MNLRIVFVPYTWLRVDVYDFYVFPATFTLEYVDLTRKTSR